MLFTVLDRDHLICVIHPENSRSIRLAERLSATRERETEISGTRALVFGIRRPHSTAPR